MKLHLLKHGFIGILLPVCFAVFPHRSASKTHTLHSNFQSPHKFIAAASSSLYILTKDTASEDKNDEGREIVENYICAIGGRINLAKIYDRTIYLSGTIEGRDLNMIIYQKSPGKMREEIYLGPVRQVIVFDGSEGATRIGGKTLEITGHELEKLKYESMPRFPLNFDSLGIKIEYLGREKINGTETEKVRMEMPGGAYLIQFYDSSSHLKIRELSSISVTEGEYIQETDYGDYNSVNGIKYPFTLIQKLGRHKSSFKVDSIKINSGLDNDLFDLP